MTVYLALGSNQGDRRRNLDDGVASLVAAGFRLERVSPIVESPAMLPPEAEPGWNKPYLNIVISGETDWTPAEGLVVAKTIESSMGRDAAPRWSPRPIDIDLLVWHDQIVNSEELKVPHIGIADRDFVITPLMHIAPGLQIPGLGKSAFELSLGRKNIPLWMGILNITPDSFSDGNSWFDQEVLDSHLGKLVQRDVQIIDIGAESTRPNAAQLNDDAEWQRLEPVLEAVQEKIKGRYVRPLISLDSRHPEVIRRALDIGIDVINDVSGLADPEMREIIRNSSCDVVAMHAMTVPVDPQVLLPSDRPPLEQMMEWMSAQKQLWEAE